MCLGRDFGSSFAWVKMNSLAEGFALWDWGQDEFMEQNRFKIGFLNQFSKELTICYHGILKFGGQQSIVYTKK